jgi:hypothetical protein
MNVKELIKELQSVQATYEKYHAKEYGKDDASPDVRLNIKVLGEEYDDWENYWIESVELGVGSGYEEHPEVILSDD